MFLYKSCGVLVFFAFFAWLGNANAGEAGTTDQRGDLASGAARQERGGDQLGMTPANSKSPATGGAKTDRRVRSSILAFGKIASTVVADRAHHSINAIGARRAEAVVAIVEREDHQFYVVRHPSSENDDEKTASAANSVQIVDAGRRFVEAARAGNLFVDESLLLKWSATSESSQR